jgi:hypothetical protein
LFSACGRREENPKRIKGLWKLLRQYLVHGTSLQEQYGESGRSKNMHLKSKGTPIREQHSQ